MKYVLSLALVLIIGVGCSHRQTIGGNNKITLPKVLSIWSPWVKDKATKFDIRLNLVNESGQPIIIYSGEVHCYRGSTEGRISNVGKRVIDFAVGETKTFNTHCDFDSAGVRGDFRIRVAAVYANPNRDTVTKGALLGNNIELAIPEANLNY
jgi:hypothetical protein